MNVIIHAQVRRLFPNDHSGWNLSDPNAVFVSQMILGADHHVTAAAPRPQQAPPPLESPYPLDVALTQGLH